MTKSMLSPPNTDAKAELLNALGQDGFSERNEHRSFMSQDIWSKGVDADFVASPASVDELSRTVTIANKHGISLNPRGGGMSYTKGYTPDRSGVGILDLARLDRVIEINVDDMYVTVEAGCTWDALYRALKENNVRVPFWGPLSGLTSTIGGGLSQNNAFFGAGLYGTTSESLLALTVVLADGTIVRTGSAGTKGAKPFFRHYGPDLAGVFCGDAGALGYKAEITFKLIPMPEHEDWASFEFKSRDACAEAMRELASQNIASEIFGFDPTLQRVRMKRASLTADAKALSNVIKGQGSLLKGLKEGAKVALAGRSFVDDAAHSLHFVVEGRSQSGVHEGMQKLKAICENHQGKASENSIPKIIRANPFGPLNNILGPKGERWVPIHGIVPLSEGPAAWAGIDAAFGAMREELDKHEILTGYLITTIGSTGYLIEPVFIWPEELFEIHKDVVGEDWLKKLDRFEPNPAATAVVEKARQAVLDVFSKHGAAHFQIGRTYPYKQNRVAESWTLLEKIKSVLDPHGQINPGALGLSENKNTASSPTINARNPRNGEYDFTFKATSPAQMGQVANRLRQAQKNWASISLDDRALSMRKLADSIRKHASEIATALEIDTGRRRIAKLEVDGVSASIEGWIAQAPHLLPDGWTPGRQNPAMRHAPQFSPFPLVGVISPWNFPLTLSLIDTIPALLAGCAVIVKPSEVTSRFVIPMQAAIADAGMQDILAFAPGGGDTGAALITNADAICFTGSVPTGRKVAMGCAEQMIPAFLELGGKDPLIILEKADIEKATDAALRGSVLATGQACQSIERIYAHQSIYDEIVDMLAKKAEAVRLNWPNIEQGEIGPIIFEKQADILQRHIDDAVKKGARILTGGKIEHHGGGLWLRPTVIANATHDMLVMHEETFGPIMPVMAYRDTDTVINLANDTEYGLSAAVFGATVEDAELVGRQIDAGAISLNDAALTSIFHEAEKHAFKASGLGGSRMGPAGFQRFLRRKALIANTGTPMPIAAMAEDAGQ